MTFGFLKYTRFLLVFQTDILVMPIVSEGAPKPKQLFEDDFLNHRTLVCYVSFSAAEVKDTTAPADSCGECV